jgi:hypothetical protein
MAEVAPAPHGSKSTRTVVVALAVNLGIALAKLLVALMSGSRAMLAEAVHAFADAGNQVLLTPSPSQAISSAALASRFARSRARPRGLDGCRSCEAVSRRTLKVFSWRRLRQRAQQIDTRARCRPKRRARKSLATIPSASAAPAARFMR